MDDQQQAHLLLGSLGLGRVDCDMRVWPPKQAMHETQVNNTTPAMHLRFDHQCDDLELSGAQAHPPS